MEISDEIWIKIVIIPTAILGILICAFDIMFLFAVLELAFPRETWVFLSTAVFIGLIIAFVVLMIHKTLEKEEIVRLKEAKRDPPFIYITNIQDLIP